MLVGVANGQLQYIRTESTFDAQNRVPDTRTKTVLYATKFFDPATTGTNAPHPNGAGETTSFTYDPNANQTSVTDAPGHTTTSIYDAGNRVTEVIFPATGTAAPARRTTVYDGWGHKTRETNESGVATAYAYDFRGLLTAVTVASDPPQAATYSYQYDKVGNQISQTDPLNHTTTFQYHALVEDGAGNLIIVEAKGGASGLKRVASGNQQMSQGWIHEKIQELRTHGQEALANRLRNAADNNTLKAMVVKTREAGPKAFEPAIQLKSWDSIGELNCSN